MARTDQPETAALARPADGGAVPPPRRPGEYAHGRTSTDVAAESTDDQDEQE